MMSVLAKEGKATFLQLYVDSPHAHIKMPFKPPVSGRVVTCGLSHPNFQGAIMSNASNYIHHMWELNDRLVVRLACRIEQVVRFEEDIPMVVDAANHFHRKKLRAVLSLYRMVLPFEDNEKGKGLLTALREVTNTLAQLCQHSSGAARFDAIWTTFQAELALEELLYGRPLSPMDFHLSVSLTDHSLTHSLTTNTVSEFNLSRQSGIVGLAQHNAAVSKETTPPLQHWTRDAIQKMRIEWIFPLCHILESAPSVEA